MTTTRWFDDEDPQPDGPQRAFVEALRTLAAGWRFDDDLHPGCSDSWGWVDVDERAWVIEISVPGLTAVEVELRARYWPQGEGMPLLHGEWGNKYLFDGPTDSGDLVISGLDASPSECAAWTAAWFEKQLRRPIVRWEWDRPTTGAARFLPSYSKSLAVVEWRFGDTGDVLMSTSSLVWRSLIKTPPSRQIEERPDRRVT